MVLRSFRLAVVLCLVALPLAAQESNHPLWKALKAGNAVYVRGSISYSGLAQLRRDLDKPDTQKPPVAILSCADSRVPPELVFDRTLNEVFVVRIAGNVADTFGLASLEYAVDKGWVHLIVVMGHSRCGAVDAALKPTNDKLTPSLIALVDRIRQSFPSNWRVSPPPPNEAVKMNALASAAWLPAHSTVIKKAVDNGRVTIIAAYYDMGSGEVHEVRAR
ncbi:MAG TPA: carbonic anhydrase [Thermoanaerobaculia bacterium]|jgi:carbonic anhydrase|nr:carbonic anhydrase [Thermoanaerobaculia bacterium]